MDTTVQALTIEPTTSVADFQASFRQLYPLLKIEFFTKSHNEFKGSFSKFKVFDTSKRLGSLGKVQETNIINCSPNMTVVDFENQLENQFSLHTQIYRRGNGVWIETIESDIWTLAEQSRIAEKSQQEVTNNK